jgi:hypothetical protein
MHIIIGRVLQRNSPVHYCIPFGLRKSTASLARQHPQVATQWYSGLGELRSCIIDAFADVQLASAWLCANCYDCPAAEYRQHWVIVCVPNELTCRRPPHLIADSDGLSPTCGRFLVWALLKCSQSVLLGALVD